jgi:predicted permease
MRPVRPGWLVVASAAVYHVALRLFPPGFRRDCGTALAVTFADLSADCHARRGSIGLARLWMRALPDLLRQASAERWAVWTGRPLSLAARRPISNTLSWRTPMRTLLHDLRFAVRALRRTPWHTTAVAATLALGMGSALTIFSVLYGVLLRPLPFPGSDRVVQLCEMSLKTRAACVASPANVADLARQATVIDAAGVARRETFTAESERGRFSVDGAVVTPGFFAAVGLRADAGRLFVADDLPPGRNGVAVVSHAFWRGHLGGDTMAVGRSLRLDGRDFRIVGVLPHDAVVPDLGDVEIWKPLTASIDDVANRSWRGFTGLARAREGERRESVVAELEAIHRQLVAAYPDDNKGWTLRVDGLRDRMVRPVQSMLWIFQAAGLVVLAIACANVAGLLLVRGAARDAEFAIRTSLGAGRSRLVRQLLFEGLLVSTAGGLAGLALAAAGTRALVRVAPLGLPRLSDVTVDLPVALAAAGLAGLTTVVFGLVPLARRSVGRPAGALRAQRTGAGARLQVTFVVAQLSLAVTLLFGAGLVGRALQRVSVWEPGFDRRNLTNSWLLASPDRFGTPDDAVAALLRARDIAAGTPGVVSAGLVSAGPLFGGEETGELRVAGSEGDGRTVTWFDADEGYLPALGVRPLKGRLIAPIDTGSDPHVAVVNDTLARLVFGQTDPIGRHVTVDGYTSAIVGVIPTLLPARPDVAPRPEIYWPLRQYKRYAAYLVLRTGSGTAADADVRRRLAADVPDVQIFGAQSIDALFESTLGAPRFNTWLIGLFALIALVLAEVGLFGTIAYTVSTRARDIGVRMALGATPRSIAAAVVTRTLSLTCAGVVLGLLFAVPLSSWLSGLLYGFPALDPPVLILTMTASAAVSALAGYVPARRASRVDPVRVLRAE